MDACYLSMLKGLLRGAELAGPGILKAGGEGERDS